MYLTGLFSENLIAPYRILIESINAFFTRTKSKNIKIIKQQLNDLKASDVKKLNKLIVSCLKNHPCFGSFKTVRFVYRGSI